MTTAFVVGAVRLLCGARARWLGCDPAPTQRIYFANHTSNLDAVVIWASLPPDLRKNTRPVAAKDYWASGGIKPYLANDIFHAVLIERKKVTVHDNPLTLMLAALDEGSSLIIFPEGGRQAGPEPQVFKGGLYHLAKDRPNVELVPVYLENLNRVLPKGEILPVPMLGGVTIGAPIRLNPDENKTDFLERSRRAVWDLHLT